MFKRITAALAALSLAGCLAGAANAATLNGAGATFPQPLYSKWAETYRARSGDQLNYQGVGSGAGIRQIKAATVDFGATDKPLKPEEQQSAGLLQFPTVIGGVVPVVNLPGVGSNQLRLDGPTLAAIFLGDIKRWNDPRIAALNPGRALPGLPITVAHRSDGSGTSFLFTSYLSKVSGAWGGRVGANDSVEWPTGQGGKGNDGVAAIVRQTPGAIGYVEFVFLKQGRLASVAMKNRDGRFVEPSAMNFAAAAARADWAHAPGYYLLMLDQPGPSAWPISGATFILMYKDAKNPAASAAVLKFWDWCYANGDAQAEALDYVPLPARVKAMVRHSWGQVVAGGRPVYAP